MWTIGRIVHILVLAWLMLRLQSILWFERSGGKLLLWWEIILENGSCICCCGVLSVIWKTVFFVCSITVWNDVNRWLKFSVIAKLFNRSCSASSSLNDVLIYFLKVLFFSSIFRKSSCEKEKTMMDYSLDSDEVVLVLVECRSVFFLEDFTFSFDSWELIDVFEIIRGYNVPFHCVL